jgi:hypothetical protein
MATEKRLVSIVGSSFYPGAGNWIAKMARGQELRVERQPNNQYDANAVAVYVFNQQLGHFPRGFAAEVAPLMDAGKKLSATKSRDPRFDGQGVMVVEWETSDAQTPEEERAE